MATKISIKDLGKRKHPVPASMLRVRGILRGREKAMDKHLKRVRKEWNRF
ncbi:hypothetical protein HY478_03615 [Candidatus Uhrbacteria bacterium]|nr:hypothetical protein [Candidatus Uhrbacteria bacterium]